MGCDIHTHAEKQTNGEWVRLDFIPFCWRSYRLFAFLAGVRNYSKIKPISEPRGIPDDSNIKSIVDDDPEYHSCSWLSVEELLNFDYDQEIEDRRTYGFSSHSCEEGEGAETTYRELLGEYFFEDLEKLNSIGAERIVFYFDS